MTENGNGMKVRIVLETAGLGIQIRGILLAENKDGVIKKTIDEIITHPTVDIDAAAVPAILNYAGVHLPRLTFEALDRGGRIRGMTPEKLLAEGIMTVDVGGGEFDHHPAERFPGECATTLIYKLIPGIMKNEKLDKFVSFVLSRDTKQTQQPFDLSHICKILATNNEDRAVCRYVSEAFEAWMCLNSSTPNKELFLKIFEEFAKGKKNIPQIILKYKDNVENDKTSNIPDLLRITAENTRDLVRIVLEEAYQNQVEFDEARKMMEKVPRVALEGNFQRELGDRFLTFAQTDNKQFVKAALYEGFSVIIVKNSKGQVQIFSQANHHIPMSDIASAIVAEEIKVSGNEGGQRWYFHQAAKSLLNGSRTTPNQIPTALSLEKIVEIITKVFKINNGYLPLCRGGKFPCSEKCDYYLWDVSMCQETRKQQNSNNRGEIVVSHTGPGESKLRRRSEAKIKKLNPQHS